MHASTRRVTTGISNQSCTAPYCRWATFACVVATPVLLRCRPACHPVGKPGVTIIWRRCGAHWSASTSPLVGAAFPMHSTAPLLLSHRPACLPVGESICAVVGVSGPCWRHWHRRWSNRHWRWRNWHGTWWWCRGRAPAMMHPAAPFLLVCLPCALCIHCAIERIHRSSGPGW